MKNVFRSYFLMLTFLVTFSALSQNNSENIFVKIDLVNIDKDRVPVTIFPPKISLNEVTFFIPKIVPGTYSEDDYGRFIDNFKAYDSKGKELSVVKSDDNSWKISQAKTLSKITYLVNDTFDIEDTHTIFSPAGTNIEEGVNFLLNMHGFVGYFLGMNENPYRIEITKPESLFGVTAMMDLDVSESRDVFETKRYAELADNPVMYSKPDYKIFMVDDMEIIVSVYSPNGVYTTEQIMPEMEKMLRTQKNFLGTIDNTKKYAILLYLSDVQKSDAGGYGALEHNTSTVVVFPEAMQREQLMQSLIDVVSHEFFHIVTPLSVHSNEIHFFDFNSPKMSQHLWMYEGITEYFANLFQVNQGLISDEQFYERLTLKIRNSKSYDDTMPFTKMGVGILKKPYKDNFLNVYEKGALIAMCIDIIIREKSNGEKGILNLMHSLSNEFGHSKPFNDDELFRKIELYTYPEVRMFLDNHVAGGIPVNYDDYFAKVGVVEAKIEKIGIPFMKGQTPLITINPSNKEIILLNIKPLSEFFTHIGMQGGDVILKVNDTAYNYDNIYDLIMTSMNWNDGEPIKIDIRRDGELMTINGKIKMPVEEVDGLKSTDDSSKTALREAWLRG